MKSSAVIIVAINTPYLMEMDGKFIDEGCAVDEIQWVLKRGLENDDKERMILFVPIKCERYLETREDRENLSRQVKNAFDKTLRLTSQPTGSLWRCFLFRRWEMQNSGGSDSRPTTELNAKFTEKTST